MKFNRIPMWCIISKEAILQNNQTKESIILKESKNTCNQNTIVDLHMHVVPSVDDGSRNMEESLEMIRLAEKQGVTDIFCTSHNGYSAEDGEKYCESFRLLKEAVIGAGISVRLHKGCEVLCAAEYMEDILYGLDEGIFQTLGETKYVLTEFYPDTKPSEALTIIQALQEHGYKPIIAHMERYYNLTGFMVGVLIQSGALIQVNAFSFSEEENEQIRKRACELLENQYIHFIGSDAHRLVHRPPAIRNGVCYILENAEQEYAQKILNGNAKRLLVLS